MRVCIPSSLWSSQCKCMPDRMSSREVRIRGGLRGWNGQTRHTADRIESRLEVGAARSRNVQHVIRIATEVSEPPSLEIELASPLFLEFREYGRIIRGPGIRRLTVR